MHPQYEDMIIAEAIGVLEHRMAWVDGANFLYSANDAITLARLRFGTSLREEFAVMFLSKQMRLISYEVMFKGSLDSVPVWPREIVRRALELGAAAIILTHNHPSGDSTPGQDDIRLTENVEAACNLFGIKLCDHLVVAGARYSSLKELGML